MKPESIPEISSLELARALEAREKIQIVDVRAPARVATGRIEGIPDARFHNIVASRLLSFSTFEGTGIDPGTPVAVVCGHGNDSKVAALHLNMLGCNARSLKGGMVAWMMLSIPRSLPAPPSLDRLVQFDRIGKGALGYLLISNSKALIIDPPRNAQPYLNLIAEAGATLVGVADTHVHADYISGGPGLSRMLDIPYYLQTGDAVYPYDGTPGKIDFREIRDGASIGFGRCSVRVMQTPGHTLGSVTYVVDNVAAFTGDFLFVASLGRPDLAGKTREWTALLWKSLETIKREWQPDLMIYPAHYGLPGERRDDYSVGKSFGQLLQENESLRIKDQTAFSSWVEGKVGEFPQAYRIIKAINVGLLRVSEIEAEELEAGKNECALPGR